MTTSQALGEGLSTYPLETDLTWGFDLWVARPRPAVGLHGCSEKENAIDSCAFQQTEAQRWRVVAVLATDRSPIQSHGPIQTHGLPCD